jgi:hypothetical protein
MLGLLKRKIVKVVKVVGFDVPDLKLDGNGISIKDDGNRVDPELVGVERAEGIGLSLFFGVIGRRDLVFNVLERQREDHFHVFPHLVRM